MDGQWCDLHDISDVEQVEPLRLVQIAKQYFHVERCIVTKTVI